MYYVGLAPCFSNKTCLPISYCIVIFKKEDRLFFVENRFDLKNLYAHNEYKNYYRWFVLLKGAELLYLDT